MYSITHLESLLPLGVQWIVFVKSNSCEPSQLLGGYENMQIDVNEGFHEGSETAWESKLWKLQNYKLEGNSEAMCLDREIGRELPKVTL